MEYDPNLSAFIVERSFEGFSVGPEEKKMGIKGSSTTPIYFDNCKVPTENLLGDRNQGFKMALNILNGGRIKAGAGGVGGLLATVDGDGDWYSPTWDANGNVSEYLDASGTIVAHREYSPFGQTTVLSGAMQDDFTFWFSTKYLEPETGGDRGQAMMEERSVNSV